MKEKDTTHIKLEPRGSTSKPHSLEDKFNVLFEVIKEIRSELKLEREIKERDRAEFKKIQRDSQDNLKMVCNIYETMAIKRANATTEQEELRDEILEKVKNLSESSSIGHRCMDQIKKKQKKS